MPISDAFLTDGILATNDYAEYKMVFVKVIKGRKDEESYASKFVASMLDDDINDSGNRLEPDSHKENPKDIDDDDVNDDEKKDDVEDKDNNDHTNHALVSTQKMGSLEFRTEQM
nr:hypothetical protein [Tanacetum cinerariifolium]